MWVGYNTVNSISYQNIDWLAPNYTKLIQEEISERMAEWMQRMPDESLQDYNTRVNSEGIAQRTRLLEEEIATRLAQGTLDCSQFSLGGYNVENGVLEINFENLPTIFLSIPQNQLKDFSDASQLQFNNPRYTITEKDGFQLVYLEVLNKYNGKSYIFDNRDRKSLDYLKMEDKYIPLDVLQLKSIDEGKLTALKDAVVSDAQSRNIISNHTKISVNTAIEPEYASDGRRILNYSVGFKYDVEKEYSAQEDFAAGKYRVPESGAATSMVEIIKQAFNGELKQYLKAGTKVRISITGMADILRISDRGLYYDGSYGDFIDEPVYTESGLESVSVTRQQGISNNTQLAFIRAAGMRDYIEKMVPSLSSMDKDYEFHTELSDNAGGAYRRIAVKFTFVDAFQK